MSIIAFLKRIFRRKMDRKLVSDQPWEMRYIASEYKVPHELVVKTKAEVGRSRKKIDDRLIELGYENLPKL